MGQCQQQHEQKYLGQERDKSHYEGDVDDLGRPHGKGVLYYRDGARFTGDFDGGFPTHGLFEYHNGHTYEGDMHKCLPHGKGVLKDDNGTFDGEFEHGDFIHGTVNYADGSVYKGDMRNGVRSGANS